MSAADGPGVPGPGSTRLAELTFREVGRRAAGGTILAVPLGATEQHGPHLPLSTDTDLAVALCDRLAMARSDVLVAPAVTYGSSGEHDGFAGTLSIGQAAIEMVVTELGRSAARTFAHVVFVSAHGGNTEPVARAVAVLRSEFRDVLLHVPRWIGDPHAGHEETSMLLELAPTGVQMDLAVRGDTRRLTDTWPLLRSGGVAAVTPTGVLGDPRRATAAAGRALLADLSGRLVEAVVRWRAAVAAV